MYSTRSGAAKPSAPKQDLAILQAINWTLGKQIRMPQIIRTESSSAGKTAPPVPRLRLKTSSRHSLLVSRVNRMMPAHAWQQWFDMGILFAFAAALVLGGLERSKIDLPGITSDAVALFVVMLLISLLITRLACGVIAALFVTRSRPRQRIHSPPSRKTGYNESAAKAARAASPARKRGTLWRSAPDKSEEPTEESIRQRASSAHSPLPCPSASPAHTTSPPHATARPKISRSLSSSTVRAR